ncbi:transmembrane 6 superfamily member 2 isoform X2 [Alexandromys fortis]|uniref:transmembrane 6 superfamily member 2 isoform X2 n=1 Tax=Alexandromys fortis TaxID=100897 RepID=UPI0021532701|nr:transmembrane 6 superfamily member 2 isoform X2 [Microtus fortis]
MDIPPLAGKTAALSLGALPLSYVLNQVSAFSQPLCAVLMSALILGLLFMAVYSLSHGEITYDPLYAVFVFFSFTSVVDLVIALQEDGYMVGFMDFYTKEGEPYLRTAHGIFICYWDGTVHYLLYLAMAGAIRKRKRYRNLGLYWLGSFAMSLLVFLPGNILGKYSSEIRPAFFLAILYMLVPCWAGVKIFSQSRAPTSYTLNMVQEEQKKGLLQRPADLVMVTYLVLAAFFTLFRGLVVLDCPTDACFIYIYQYEPYLRDPVAYPKLQVRAQVEGESCGPAQASLTQLPESHASQADAFRCWCICSMLCLSTAWLPMPSFSLAAPGCQTGPWCLPEPLARRSSHTWVPPCTCAHPSPTACLRTPGPPSF